MRLFSDGREALKLADECEPEVVVSDIKMPDIDGLDLLRKMKEIHSSLPIIIMTAYADLDKAVESFSSGAFEYLPKPFDIEEMLKIVKRAKRKRERIKSRFLIQKSNLSKQKKLSDPLLRCNLFFV